MESDDRRFWNSARQRFFLFLCRNPQSEYYDRQVSVHSGVGKSAANLALRQLARWGWVRLRMEGRMKYYRVNLDDPVIRQAKIMDAVIYMESDKIVDNNEHRKATW
ncbi:MAG: hypothetical protein QME74_09240, partial [Candidatus Edwardsbacteria bacterium]|nr:hypothetical protein [Candidatus Edwardsbacteria bacterium]